jgi:hypothetical protein
VSAGLLFGAGAEKSAAKRTTPHSKTHRSTSTKQSAKAKASSKSRRAVHSTKSRSTKKSTRAKARPRYRYQLQPTAQRYTEIQQALANRGYYKGEADGHWNEDSVDALRRFQQDQNLTPTGKLDSLSLIALGLGPKRNLSARSESSDSSDSSDNQSRPPDDNRRTEGSEGP